MACRFFAEKSRLLGTTSLAKLHRACYRDGRDSFKLNAAVLQQAMAKALAARRAVLARIARGMAASEPTFKRVPVLFRNDSFKVVTIGTGFGLKLPTESGQPPIVVPVEVGEYQQQFLLLLASGGAKQGSGELIATRSGNWYFHLALTLPCDEIEPSTVIGVDLGVVNLATIATTDGSLNRFLSGKPLRFRRERRSERRTGLQKCGRLKRVKVMKGKETRWMAYHNHVISKRIVKEAAARSATIALEDLTGIRDRTKLGKQGNRMIASWAFRQLVDFIIYKANLVGVPVVFVDPRGTSKTCSKCGCAKKGSRKSQADFCCRACGYRLSADLNAARNIAARGSMAPGQALDANGSVAPRMAQDRGNSAQAHLPASR